MLKRFRAFRFPWRNPREIDRDLDEELRFHLDSRADELIQSGLPPAAAREEAARQFGDLVSTREYCREQDRATERATRRSTILAELRQDLGFGVRLVLRRPGLSASAVIALSLAIGMNTTVFSFVRALVFPVVPVARPDRLVMLWAENSARGVYISPMSEPELLMVQEQTPSLGTVAGYSVERPHLLSPSGADRVVAVRGTANLLSLLGVAPALGRDFGPEDAIAGRDRVVLLSHRGWTRYLGGDPGVVGRTVRLDGEPHVVIGVLPEGFWFASREADVWLPRPAPRPDASRDARALLVVARLAPGTSRDEARGELAAAAARAVEDSRAQEGWGVRITELLPLGPGEKVFFALVVGLVALLLLAASAHVANLQLARGVDRHPELAMRSALGASRPRLVRQLLVESSLVALLGALASLAIALPCVRLLRSVFGARTPYLAELSLDGPALLLTIALAVGVTLVSGFVPAIRGSRCDVAGILRGGTVGGSRRVSRLHAAMVGGEAAAATLLLVVAVLLVRSGQAAMDVDLGFRARNVLSFEVEPPAFRYPDPADAAPLRRDILDGLRRLPGVEAAGATSLRPVQLARAVPSSTLTIEDRPGRSGSDWAQEARITTGYLEALELPLLAGRRFDARDATAALEPVIVNRAMADRYWPGGKAVGRRLRRGAAEGDGAGWLTVVGVVGNVRADDPASPPPPRLYLLEPRHPARSLFYVAATSGDARDLVEAFRSTVREVDRELPVPSVRRLEDVLDDDYAGAAIGQGALEAFGLLAAALAGLGVYSMLAYSVSRRRREIAVRQALGATRGDVRSMVLRQGMRTVLAGVVAGLAAAIVVSRGLSAILFGVSATDPLTYGVVAAGVVTATAAAALLPALRASHRDPVGALRHE